jgi:tetratricopeptide (TPR) repeat protein
MTAKRRPMGRRRRRLVWTVTLLVIGSVAGTAIGLAVYRGRRAATYLPGEDNPEITRRLARGLPEDAPEPRLTDVTQSAGLGAFRSFAGERTSQLPEDMGSGLAWGDLDNDGDDDLFLVSAGGPVGSAASNRGASELYENLGDGTFRKVEEFPDTRIIGMGAAWGDYNADGWEDLVVTGYRSLTLYRNREGRLEPDPRFPALDGYWSGASWGDYDNDRDLDLYVCAYVDYVEDPDGRAKTSQQYGKAVPYTLNPASYPPGRNLLLRNDGNGSFTEVAGELGVTSDKGRSLSALWHDLDGDGWLDLYVANDISDNVLFLNRGGTFEEVSHSAWVADYRGAMGLASADWNRDGDDDLFVTHWVAQENALYDSLLKSATAEPGGETGAPPALRFVDVTDQRGLGQVSLRLVGWGTEFVDLDGDGWLDLVVANGSTFETDGEPRVLKPQLSFLFWNARGEYFHDLAPLNEALSRPHVRRGLGVSDYDGDGDMDLAWIHWGEGVQLLRNEMQTGNWIKIRLRGGLGPEGHPVGFGDGATVVAWVGDTPLRRTVGGPSYLSQSSRVVHLGLGDATGIDRLEVLWPGGGRQSLGALEAGSVWEVTEGDDAPVRLEQIASVSGGASSPEDERARVLAFWEKQRAAMDAMKIDGDLERAMGLFREALALNPSHEDARYYLADCLARTGEPKAAMVELEKLVEVNPQSHRGYKHLGILGARTATNKADLYAAQAALERAVEINREETGALTALGEVFLLRGDYAAAEQHLAWVCQTNSRAASAFFFRGYVAWKEGDTDAATRHLERARAALGDEWVPEGTTSEGDVKQKMHTDATPLLEYFEAWDGSQETSVAFAPVEAALNRRQAP